MKYILMTILIVPLLISTLLGIFIYSLIFAFNDGKLNAEQLAEWFNKDKNK